MQRNYSFLDNILIEIDQGLKTLFLPTSVAKRPNPARTKPAPKLSPIETKRVAGLMRVNHTGEVCAQALYRGQALVAQSSETKAQLQHAAQEEQDHLTWCAERLTELCSKPSVLNPLWYTGAFLMGVVMAIFGDRYSFGFVEETERQVVDHLKNHLDKIPKQDKKTHAILETMCDDEARHGETAKESGAVALPPMIKKAMAAQAALMKAVAYWI